MPFSNQALLAFFLAVVFPHVGKSQTVKTTPYINYGAIASNVPLSNVSVGSSLSTSGASSWLSISGRFAFGFYPEGNGFLVGIQLVITPSKTVVVWTARPDLKPFPKDAFLHFTKEGFHVTPDIALVNFSHKASSAAMLDNGNFVVYRQDVSSVYTGRCSQFTQCRSESSSRSTIVWRSFDYPTDTILGSQLLPCGHNLTSAASDTNHSPGNHVLRLECDGNLVIYPVNLNTAKRVIDTSGYDYTTLMLDKDGRLYLSGNSGNLKDLSGYKPQNQSEMLYRATLDPDEVFRLYALNLDTNSSKSVNDIPYYKDRCKDICGGNSYCMLVEGKPNCSCMPGFDYMYHDAPSFGCQRRTAMRSCSAVMMNEVTNMVGVDEGAYSVVSVTSKDECSSTCLHDCDCYAALYRGQNCLKLKLPLTSGMIDVNEPSIALIKLAADSNNSDALTPWLTKEVRVAAILRCSAVTVVICVALIAASGWAYWALLWQYRVEWHKWELAITEDIAPRYFSYEELVRGPEPQHLGKGGQGTVFRVDLPIGGKVVPVAVKRLHGTEGDGERDFHAEMRLIGRTQHVNLVRLLGFCHNRLNRLLVYEFMCRGSLADHIFESPSRRLRWERRKQLLIGAARGIQYLHQECETKIIHRDIKPENILITEDWTAKISDFGLAKLLMKNQTRTDTRTVAAGTDGYVAPESEREVDGTGGIQVTEKADVYSFGVVVLETVCCRRNRESNLCAVVRERYLANEIGMVLDGEEMDVLDLERFVKLGILCVQEEPEARPFMEEVVMMLEGAMDVPNPQLQP